MNVPLSNTDSDLARKPKIRKGVAGNILTERKPKKKITNVGLANAKKAGAAITIVYQKGMALVHVVPKKGRAYSARLVKKDGTPVRHYDPRPLHQRDA